MVVKRITEARDGLGFSLSLEYSGGLEFSLVYLLVYLKVIEVRAGLYTDIDVEGRSLCVYNVGKYNVIQ